MLWICTFHFNIVCSFEWFVREWHTTSGEEIYFHLDFREKSPVKTGVKNSNVMKIVISKEDSRPFWLQHCSNQLEYREESWRVEETCCHSEKKPSVKAGVKNSNRRKIVISKEDSRPFWLQRCSNQLEYWEESWRVEETCCHSEKNHQLELAWKTRLEWK